MTHIITHNSKHTAHIITHTLTHKKDHNPIDTPQNNPHKRRANHFAVFVPQPFRAVDKLAVGESHEMRTYTNYTSFRLSCGLRRSKNRETAGIFGTGCGNVGPRTLAQTFPTWSGLRPDTPPTPHGTRNFFASREAFPNSSNRKSRGPLRGSDFVIDDGTGKTLGLVVGVTE